MRILFILLLTAFSASLLGQTQLPLNFRSYAIKLAVARDESLVLTTRAGEVGLSPSFMADWYQSDPTKGKEFGATLDQANFFNKDTGFVSGFINSGKFKYDIIYHTTNGGKNWRAINFGQDGWVDNAVNLDNGEAWLSVAGSGIAYTADYGFTWRKLANPHIKERFTEIFFNTARQGIAGSLWNVVAYTDDNCKNWKLLPTPLNQKKYNKTNKEARPQFDRVAIFKDFLLVSQENFVFYSKKDSIDWIWLADYTDLYTDPENSALFFKNKRGNFIKVDNNLNPIYTYNIQSSNGDAKCKNGNLFVVEMNKLYQLRPDNKVIEQKISSNEPESTHPSYVGYTSAGQIGIRDNKVFLQKDYNGPWTYLFTFPLSLNNAVLSVIDEDKLLYNKGTDSLYYFNMSGDLKSVRSKTTMIANFGKNGIKKISFFRGSQGCFHYFNNELEYTNFSGNFEGAMEIPHGSKGEPLPENEDVIEGKLVEQFFKKLPEILSVPHLTSINDLNFTNTEYERCKKDILEFRTSLLNQNKKRKKETAFNFNRNNLDFDKLLNMVDSIKQIRPEILTSILAEMDGILSTTTNWTRIQFVNNENEVLTISSYYYNPNAFYFPWVVQLNGYTVQSTNIEINRFVQSAYPNFLENGKRIEILHRIARELYDVY